ncbi:MAG: preprotein translocase subunit YajC [Pedosphaera sp.]|nr:preprotein translocase subunit YajC [Pedosphaera sp.]
MEFNWNNIILGMAPPPQGTAADPKGEMLKLVGMMVLMGVMVYLVMWRPQQKRQRALAELLKNVKSGDRILTTSGIIATVITVKEKSVTIRSADAKFEITKTAIAEITERSGETSES